MLSDTVQSCGSWVQKASLGRGWVGPFAALLLGARTESALARCETMPNAIFPFLSFFPP